MRVAVPASSATDAEVKTVDVAVIINKLIRPLNLMPIAVLLIFSVKY